MRNLFWILLLGNVILFAVMQRVGLGWGGSEMQAQPYLHGEMIRLMPRPQSTPSKILSAPVAVSAPIPILSAPNPVAKMAAPSAAKSGTPICLEWGDFSGPDLVRAGAALSSLQLADKLSQRLIEHDIGYWVYIPPLKGKAAVNRKIAELKALGVREYFVMQTSGRWLNAISLGVFKTRDAAQNFLHNLQAIGIHSARVGERASKLKATIFMLDRVDAATEVKLTAMQKDFAGSELNNVPCTLTK